MGELPRQQLRGRWLHLRGTVTCVCGGARLEAKPSLPAGDGGLVAS